MPEVTGDAFLGRKPQIKPDNPLPGFRSELFNSSLRNVRVHTDGKSFLAQFGSEMRQTQQQQDGILCACQGGHERSRKFNDSMKSIGLNIPDFNGPIDGPKNGVSLASLLAQIEDRNTYMIPGGKGLKIEGYEKPIKRFVFTIKDNDSATLERLGKAFDRLSQGYKGQLPLKVDFVREPNEAQWSNDIDSFVKAQPAPAA